jgi:hypothetical protein
VTTRASFTPEEWKLIMETPVTVGVAVSTAEKSGFTGQTKEDAMMLQAIWSDPEKEFARCQLIQEMLQHRQERTALVEHGALQERDDFSVFELRGKGVDQQHEFARPLAVDQCHAVIRLLENKATPTETELYKIFVMSVAEKVARAAKEGGLFSKNEHHISDRERIVMQEIAAALDHEFTIND